MIQSAIDLGTNTVLMVSGHLNERGTVDILDDAHEIGRLGKGVDAERRILPETIDRVCDLLAAYRKRADGLGAERVCAYGTSALRDARNKEEFIAAVASRAGIELVELSGTQEARCTFAGAAFGLNMPDAPYAVLDIGGGSTELALGPPGLVQQSQSVDVGAVRVTERFFDNLPPTPEQVHGAQDMISQRLGELFSVPASIRLIGVAGTATTLGALDAGVVSFDSRDLDGHELSVAAVDQLSQRLLRMNHAAIRSLPQVNEQRADIITAGALILSTFLHAQGLSGLTVSTRGIRYGLLMDMLHGTR